MKSTICNTNTTSIHTLINPQDLQKCILSTYICDFDWLQSTLFDNQKIKTVLFVHSHQDEYGLYHDSHFTIIFPKLAQHGVMHIKFMLLFYSSHLRIVITSANLVPIDYDTLINTMFLIDLPVQKNPMISNCGIYNDLCCLIDLMGFPQSKSTTIWSVLQHYQWSLTNHLTLIYNCPILPSSSALSMLSNYTQKLNHSSSCHQTTVEYVGSSLSGISTHWIHSFQSAISSSSVLLQVIYPTKSYAECNDTDHFQSMFCTPRIAEVLLNSPLLHRCESIDPDHPGIHSKIMSVSCQCAQNYVLITSANFSLAAWSKQRNWELGVIINNQLPSEIYPYRRNPLPLYSTDDLPWCQHQ